jgi:hypothetical protein
MLMRTVFALAIVLIFAGSAHAQFSGGVINTGGSSINHATTLNTNVSTSTTNSGSASAASDVVVNRNSKNPGEFVPSKYSTYQDVLAEAKLEAALRPTTVAEAARQEQERRSKSKDANVIQFDEDAQGKLVIAQAKK